MYKAWSGKYMLDVSYTCNLGDLRTCGLFIITYTKLDSQPSSVASKRIDFPKPLLLLDGLAVISQIH